MNIEEIDGVEMKKSIYYKGEYMGHFENEYIILDIPSSFIDISADDTFYEKCLNNLDNIILQFDNISSPMLFSIQLSGAINLFSRHFINEVQTCETIFKSLEYNNIDIFSKVTEKIMWMMDVKLDDDSNYLDINWWKKCYKVYNRNKTIDEIL